jgi:integrase
MNEVQPIRDRRKINAIKEILMADNPRNHLLFVMGINTGLRVSDLLRLRVEDVMVDGKVASAITIREKKTGKQKRFGVNKAVADALADYVGSMKLSPRDSLFRSRKGEGPITRQQAYRIINKACKTVGVQGEIGTHTLRKTFGYHARLNGTPIEVLQNIFNHSAPSVTMRYLGITQDELDDVYSRLNL